MAGCRPEYMRSSLRGSIAGTSVRRPGPAGDQDGSTVIVSGPVVQRWDESWHRPVRHGSRANATMVGRSALVLVRWRRASDFGDKSTWGRRPSTPTDRRGCRQPLDQVHTEFGLPEESCVSSTAARLPTRQ